MATKKRKSRKKAQDLGSSHPLIVVPPAMLSGPNPDFELVARWDRLVEKACKGIENEGPLSLRRSKCDDVKRRRKIAMRKVMDWIGDDRRVNRPTFHGLGAAPMPTQTKLILGGGIALIAFVAMNRQKVAKVAVQAAETAAAAVKGAVSGILTMDTIRKAMPNVKITVLAEHLPNIVEAFEEAQINTPARIAAFLAQCGHESGDFKYMAELASGEDYNNRCGTEKEQIAKYGKFYGGDLGNCQPGDGPRFKGRGPIQLTGRNNYRKFTEAIGAKYGVDFEKNPELVKESKWGFKAAAWFWNMRDGGLNKYADEGRIGMISYLVNGGCNGYDDRIKRYETAKAALGVNLPTIVEFPINFKTSAEKYGVTPGLQPAVCHVQEVVDKKTGKTSKKPLPYPVASKAPYVS